MISVKSVISKLQSAAKLSGRPRRLGMSSRLRQSAEKLSGQPDRLRNPKLSGRLEPLVLLLLVAALTGCNSRKNCYESTDVYLRLGFYNDSTQKSVTARYLTLWGTDNEYLWCDSASVSVLPLALNPFQETTTYIMWADVDSTHCYVDTLVFHHTNRQRFVSMECGAVVEHTLTGMQLTHNFIADALMADEEVTASDDEPENILLYVR